MQTPPQQNKIVFLGIGAIGGSTGAWVTAHHPNTYLLGRGESAEVIRAHGITTYRGENPDRKEQVRVNLISDLDEVPDADVVVLAVKLFNLEEVAQFVKENLDDRPFIVGMQNGVDSQKILPRYFSKVVYCLVTYNAWVEAPGVIGYQTRGPLTLGTPDNSLLEEMKTLAAIFNPAVKTEITLHLEDAAHTKLVINLGNSLTTLIARPDPRDRTGLSLYQKILANTLYEGIQVVQAAGFHEERLGNIPSWATIRALTKLPQWITLPIFRRNLEKLALSSMGQDVLQRRRPDNELEYLNGYLLSLAERCQVAAPYNRVIYRLSKELFSQPDFEPLPVREVWEEIEKES
ncbi:MAG TPA: 2-dehydropantoate 2-reductase N-terminal domain-containing protein [Anaerolineaceae bacterium]|nr:2-dehydropantoate 2-reductase N-terminal domain-containing protein [Anaerolineaceae bacterium]